VNGCCNPEASARRAGEISNRSAGPQTDDREAPNSDFVDGHEPAAKHFHERAQLICGEIERSLRVDVETASAAGREEQRLALAPMNPREADPFIEDGFGEPFEALGGFFERHYCRSRSA